MQEQLLKFSFTMFGGPNELQFYASPPYGEVVYQLAIAELKRIEEKYSRFIPTSTLSNLNKTAGSGSAVKVDEETAALLDFAEVCFEQSGGTFDITSGVLSRAWNFKEKVIPSPEKIQSLMPLIGWRKVKWNKPNLTLPVLGMEIDFGGFGKEYAVEKAASLLIEKGIKNGLINLGGDLKVIGPHPDKKPWHVGIAHPRKDNDVLTTLMLMDGALATSGDYERFFEADKKRYCHIIDPKTGVPVESFQSVSVISQSCLISGSAATITMLLGINEGLKFLKELKLPFIIVNQKGEMSSYTASTNKFPET